MRNRRSGATRRPTQRPTSPLARGVGEGGVSSFSIASLFAAGEQGGWYDPSDLSTLFSDSAGTTPAVVDGPVGKMLDKSGRGNHATQATTAAKPYLRSSGGLYWLEYDGVDDWMTVAFAAVPSAELAVVAGRATSVAVDSGFYGNLNSSALAGFQIHLATSTAEVRTGSGAALSSASAGTVTAGVNFVLAGYAGSGSQTARRNGVAGTSVSATRAAGAVGYALGRRSAAQASEYLGGRIYGLVSLHRAATGSEIANIERTLAAKSGVTL
jgi:hypothetical protein